MGTYNSNILPASTGIDLGSTGQRFDLFAQNLDVSGTVTFSSVFTPSNLGSIRFADQFSGASVTAKIDAALADAGTLLVVIPATMGAGNATSISAGKCILDLRSGVPKFFSNYSASSAAWTLNDDGTVTGVAWKSVSTNPATTGQIRLAKGDSIYFRNNGNSANIAGLSKDTSDVVQVGDTAGAKVAGALSVTGALSISGALSGATTGAFTGQITSSLATGTAPFSIASTTVVPNLNVATLNGVTVSGAPSANQVLVASSASAASWSSSASSIILDKQDVLGALTGSGAAQTIYTYTMPVNTLAAGKGVRVSSWIHHSTGAANVTYTLKFGATSVINTVNGSAGTWVFRGTVFNNTGSTTAQWGMGESYNPTTPAVAVLNSAPAETTASGTIVIVLTFSVANTDQVTPRGWLVELIS